MCAVPSPLISLSLFCQVLHYNSVRSILFAMLTIHLLQTFQYANNTFYLYSAFFFFAMFKRKPLCKLFDIQGYTSIKSSQILCYVNIEPQISSLLSQYFLTIYFYQVNFLFYVNITPLEISLTF